MTGDGLSVAEGFSDPSGRSAESGPMPIEQKRSDITAEIKAIEAEIAQHISTLTAELENKLSTRDASPEEEFSARGGSSAGASTKVKRSDIIDELTELVDSLTKDLSKLLGDLRKRDASPANERRATQGLVKDLLSLLKQLKDLLSQL